MSDNKAIKQTIRFFPVEEFSISPDKKGDNHLFIVYQAVSIFIFTVRINNIQAVQVWPEKTSLELPAVGDERNCKTLK